MPIHIEAVNPLVAHVRSLPGVNYLTSEIAAATGYTNAKTPGVALREPGGVHRPVEVNRRGRPGSAGAVLGGRSVGASAASWFGCWGTFASYA